MGDSNEEWKAIADYGAYEISSLGRIRNARTGVVLKARMRHKYWAVDLYNDSGKRTFAVHILVSLAFHGDRPAGCEAAHDDGNRDNNRADNLVWRTRVQNEADKKRHGTDPSGERNANCRITEADAVAIRQIGRNISGRSRRSLSIEIADKFGLSASHVRRIITGERWGCLDAV